MKMPAPPTQCEPAVQASLRYLESAEAFRSIRANPYWPKWNSPWWHLTLLNELGLASRIPKRAAEAMTEALRSSPIQVFPIPPFKGPAGVDVALTGHCHCALGNIYPALAASGVAVDRELPWIRPWFLRYQLGDGGLNCIEEAYLKTPAPSSMVGTIAGLEAMLLHGSDPLKPDEVAFLDRGAKFLLDRELRLATDNPHNPDEKADEADWLKLCFPRFYLYDVLRGLTFILRWSDHLNRPLEAARISKVLHHLEKSFPSHQVSIGRQSFAGATTRLEATGWHTPEPASHFPLLDEVSRVGEVSPTLTAEWSEARETLFELQNRGLIR